MVLGGTITRLSQSIKDILRPKEHEADKFYEYNLDDWILMPKYLMIWLHGCI